MEGLGKERKGGEGSGRAAPGSRDADLHSTDNPPHQEDEMREEGTKGAGGQEPEVPASMQTAGFEQHEGGHGLEEEPAQEQQLEQSQRSTGLQHPHHQDQQGQQQVQETPPPQSPSQPPQHQQEQRHPPIAGHSPPTPSPAPPDTTCYPTQQPHLPSDPSHSMSDGAHRSSPAPSSTQSTPRSSQDLSGFQEPQRLSSQHSELRRRLRHSQPPSNTSTMGSTPTGLRNTDVRAFPNHQQQDDTHSNASDHEREGWRTPAEMPSPKWTGKEGGTIQPQQLLQGGGGFGTAVSHACALRPGEQAGLSTIMSSGLSRSTSMRRAGADGGSGGGHTGKGRDNCMTCMGPERVCLCCIGHQTFILTQRPSRHPPSCLRP